MAAITKALKWLVKVIIITGIIIIALTTIAI